MHMAAAKTGTRERSSPPGSSSTPDTPRNKTEKQKTGTHSSNQHNSQHPHSHSTTARIRTPPQKTYKGPTAVRNTSQSASISVSYRETPKDRKSALDGKEGERIYAHAYMKRKKEGANRLSITKTNLKPRLPPVIIYNRRSPTSTPL
ncbi:hypothetical protein Hypma_014634 [Hypsizygus marmoreus]|uniref:Uncharacterized protein n=1 Tax=Hypsizygus marmoreus TaxID=39966 RepID=A0A369JBP2_HYPMA|nr:hypothetical protein Hypma_014634 [Hypsizygus marmoreus]